MGYPANRMRRLRANQSIRALVRETELSLKGIIYPLFVTCGQDKMTPVPSMPGVNQYSLDRLPQELDELKELGIPAVILFGLPEYKDPVGSSAYEEHGVIQESIRLIKDKYPDILVITDVCMCEYTDHGHCGVVEPGGNVNNDATLELLAREALSHVRAGCDMVAPSDMMDGRIGFIRNSLDRAGYEHLPIMAYSAKYCSSFYGPFRDAADSAPQFGDRKTYQMDPANVNEALREVALDIEEGADIVMVKPALPYLDVIRAVKERFAYPTAAYNVSGEYAMIKAAARNGWIDETGAMLESLTSIKRAGADMIITYFAKDLARFLIGRG